MASAGDAVAGFSTDDISPDFNGDISAIYQSSNQTIEVTWDAIDANDLDYYKLYIKEGDSGEFVSIDNDLNTSYIDSNVENNLSYEYSISSTYPNGEESEKSDPVLATPLSDTVHELYWDDGTSEGGSGCDFLEYATKEACLSNGGEWGFIAGSGNYSVVKYSTYGSINEKIC